MLTRLIKILLAASSLAYTVYLFSIAQTGAAIGMIFVTIVLVMMTLKSMRLVLAFVQIRQQKMPEAKKWLGRISPNQLWPRQRGYYNFLLGSLTMEENMNVAEKYLKDAVSMGLRQTHDEAAAKLNLAVIASTKRRTREAIMLLNDCKRLDTKGMLTKDIKMVEQAVKGGGTKTSTGGRGGSSSSARQARRSKK
ncbi:MAG: DUF2892 domain-containing protein [Flavobacteriales bacterium]|nr:DUF2892 domain-containing protein [Flavobacteriales bacterium]